MPWEWLFRAKLCDLECPQGCYMEWYRSSAKVLPPIEEDCLLNLGMLDVEEKDPVAPVSASAPSSSTQDPEEEQAVLIPKESCTSEPEEASCSEGGLTCIWG